jgi:FKBP-type peptidyl-prolyl cis-trans isomerase
MKRSLCLAALLALPISCQKEKSGDKKDTGDQVEANDNAKPGAGRNVPQTGMPGHGAQVADIPAPPDVAKPPADAQKTASGLAYKVQSKGDGGDKPTAADKVTVHYTGWTTDGKMFDSSKKRNRPATFGLDRVIAGWTEGLQLMSKGDTYRFWIPEKLAYQGRPGKPAGMLVFDVELLDIQAAPKAPDDVAKPPAGAKKTPKGVFYKVLTAGTGKEKPRAHDKVSVHYTGWTTDGKMFDSSITRGRPASFNVGGVIPGWTDALQQMTTGDKWRVWIPKKLAYDGQQGRPQGMLVFDVELLSVERMPEPPPVPKDVKKTPKDAKKTSGGVAYKILQPGKGTAKPKPTSNVTVHYTGWTTDGKMFDSSVVRGKPATFNLSRVVPGWSEGLQQMTEGTRARLWIPEELAYKGKAGAPQGTLVFDVELIKFQ